MGCLFDNRIFICKTPETNSKPRIFISFSFYSIIIYSRLFYLIYSEKSTKKREHTIASLRAAGSSLTPLSQRLLLHYLLYHIPSVFRNYFSVDFEEKVCIIAAVIFQNSLPHGDAHLSNIIFWSFQLHQISGF